MSGFSVIPSVDVAIARMDWADTEIPLPDYTTAGAAGMDLRANFDPERREQGITLYPNARGTIPTGFRIALTEGYEMQVRPRSGLAIRDGVTVVNAPGTIDSDFRGEVCVLLVNLGEIPFTIHHGDRIAQMVLAPVLRCNWQLEADLSETERGSGGFGSTGIT